MVGNGISEPSTVISQQILPANSLVHPKINSSGIFQIRHQGGLWGHRQFNQQCFFRKCVFFQGGKKVVEINFGVKTLKIAGILTKPRSSCPCTSLHPSTKRPKSYLPPGGEHRESDGVLGCGRLFQTFKVWHRVFLQKLSPPLQNQHGLVQPKKNIDLKKEHHLKQTSLTLGAKAVKNSRVYRRNHKRYSAWSERSVAIGF